MLMTVLSGVHRKTKVKNPKTKVTFFHTTANTDPKSSPEAERAARHVAHTNRGFNPLEAMVVLDHTYGPDFRAEIMLFFFLDQN